jgi:hypothetical protein
MDPPTEEEMSDYTNDEIAQRIDRAIKDKDKLHKVRDLDKAIEEAALEYERLHGKLVLGSGNVIDASADINYAFRAGYAHAEKAMVTKEVYRMSCSLQAIEMRKVDALTKERDELEKKLAEAVRVIDNLEAAHERVTHEMTAADMDYFEMKDELTKAKYERDMALDALSTIANYRPCKEAAGEMKKIALAAITGNASNNTGDGSTL